MTTEESKSLKVGDRVTWKYDQADAGKVIETGYWAVKIEWEDGQVGTIDHRDMQSVTLG